MSSLPVGVALPKLPPGAEETPLYGSTMSVFRAPDHKTFPFLLSNTLKATLYAVDPKGRPTSNVPWITTRQTSAPGVVPGRPGGAPCSSKACASCTVMRAALMSVIGPTASRWSALGRPTEWKRAQRHERVRNGDSSAQAVSGDAKKAM